MGERPAQALLASSGKNESGGCLKSFVEFGQGYPAHHSAALPLSFWLNDLHPSDRVISKSDSLD